MAMGKIAALRKCATLLTKIQQSATTEILSASQLGSVAACLQHQSKQDTHSQWHRWGAICAATLGVTCALQQCQGSAECFSASTEAEDDTPSAAPEALADWLTNLGAEVDAIDIRQSQSANAGLGVFASQGLQKRLHVSWWKQPWYKLRKPNDGVVLASFPLQAAITPRTITADPVLGATYQELLDIGVVDDALLTILSLTVERQLGAESVWEPWIQSLPATLDTPLFYSDAELQELDGTTLETAVRVKKQQLADQWKRLEPACQDLLNRAGGTISQPSFEDFLWAHSIYWSRSQSFPEPVSEQGRVMALPSGGVVPGLDFCNHREESTARWTIFGNPNLQSDAGDGSSSEMPTQMALVCSRQQAPRPGQEITISYGDKSNEHLLMAYGFTQTDNLNDHLMVMCPIAGPEGQDQILQARLQLLAAKGLTPQLFLPAKLLDVRPTHSKHDRTKLHLPEAALQTLQVFVMEPKQLLAELTAAAEDETPRNTLTPVEKSGERMAVLTTLVGLLLMKHEDMEGEGGTGSLEDDIRILEEAQDDEDNHISDRKLSCIVYRSAQKRIAREYLIRAQQELANEIVKLKQLAEKA